MLLKAKLVIFLLTMPKITVIGHLLLKLL